jgi:hypothetical protein
VEHGHAADGQTQEGGQLVSKADDLDREFGIEGVKTKEDAPFEERLVGCPIWWLQHTKSLTRSVPELVVALFIWRRSSIVGSRTFNMPNGELKALGIKREAKYRMLNKLKKAGLITVKRQGQEALIVTMRPPKAKKA